jgi:hypothetical protein
MQALSGRGAGVLILLFPGAWASLLSPETFSARLPQLGALFLPSMYLRSLFAPVP